MTLRLSSLEGTSNKTCVLCGERLTPEDKEHYVDTCTTCVLDAITDQD